MPTPSFQCSSTAGSGTPNGVGGRSAGWPEDVGILAIDLYFPYQYVDQVCNLKKRFLALCIFYKTSYGMVLLVVLILEDKSVL